MKKILLITTLFFITLFAVDIFLIHKKLKLLQMLNCKSFYLNKNYFNLQYVLIVHYNFSLQTPNQIVPFQSKGKLHRILVPNLIVF